MELRQLRSLVTVAENGFSVSRAAEDLHLVQSAVSQHLKQLEDELGTHLFRRQGKRLAGLTEAGEQVVTYARATLAGAASVAAVGRDRAGQADGTLRIGATHTQARYVLPPVMRRFTGEFPQVEVQIHQGTPAQLVDLVVRDAVDLAICTEALANEPALEAVHCYRWNRCAIAPLGHPLLAVPAITLERLCEYPVITYVFGFTGRGNFSTAFARQGLRPRVVLSAADSDVIKTYVREGMGVGIMADLAYESTLDADLGCRDLSHLFPWEVTKVAYRRDKYMRGFQRRFIDLFQEQSAQLNRRGRLGVA